MRTAAAAAPYRCRPRVRLSASPGRLAQQRRCRSSHAPWRASTSPSYPPGAPQTAILAAALRHVPDCGFTEQALACGARDAGFSPASTSLFPKGAFELVLFNLVQQRLALAQLVAQRDGGGGPAPGVGAQVRRLTLARLRANAPVAGRYSEAIALMSLAGNIPASLAELGRLADDIWYLAGDTAVDSSWYSKRAMLAGVYASTEVFMSQDKSDAFKETEHFLDRRLSDVRTVGGAAGDVGQWLGFTASSTVNVLRSWGVRI